MTRRTDKVRGPKVTLYDIDYALKHLNDLLTKGEAFGSMRVKKKNGKYAWLELSGKKFTSSKGTEKIIFALKYV